MTKNMWTKESDYKFIREDGVYVIRNDGYSNIYFGNEIIRRRMVAGLEETMRWADQWIRLQVEATTDGKTDPAQQELPFKAKEEPNKPCTHCDGRGYLFKKTSLTDSKPCPFCLPLAANYYRKDIRLK